LSVTTPRLAVPQHRTDGWNTYYKFFLWRLDAFFDVVLFLDADALFMEDPSALFSGFYAINAAFLVSEEPHGGYDSSCTGGCSGPGFNSHMMMLRPNRTVFEELLRKAHARDYIPFTNGEQDVLEGYFCDNHWCRGEEPAFEFTYRGPGADAASITYTGAGMKLVHMHHGIRRTEVRTLHESECVKQQHGCNSSGPSSTCRGKPDISAFCGCVVEWAERAERPNQRPLWEEWQ
jgi:hypothetical protein